MRYVDIPLFAHQSHLLSAGHAQLFLQSLALFHTVAIKTQQPGPVSPLLSENFLWSGLWSTQKPGFNTVNRTVCLRLQPSAYTMRLLSEM